MPKKLIIKLYLGATLVDSIDFGVIDTPITRNLVELLILSKRLKLKTHDRYDFT